MDSPPPPNDNNNPNGDAARASSKEEALRPRARGVNEDGDVEVFNLQDNGIVVVMFLFGVASWMLRERCVC
jgi:hypothetical protein